MSEPYTSTEVLETLEQVVHDAGSDYVDPIARENAAKCTSFDCQYVSNDAPACIVARVLSRLGATVDQLKRLDTYWQSNFDSIYVDGRSPVPLTQSAANLLVRAQNQQDMGLTWGAILSNLYRASNE